MPHAPLVIVNPAAGGGRAGRFAGWLRERLAGRPGARLEITRSAGHAEELAGRAITGHDRIIAVGGDGTIQEVTNGLGADPSGPSLGIVPLGSGNDLARSLGLPSDPAEAWTVAVGSRERTVDLLLASHGPDSRRWFGSAGGVGFDAQVANAMARRSTWQRGRGGYLLTTLAELRRFTNGEVRISVDGASSTHRVLFVAIANGEFYGGGMRIAPGAAVDDGLLDVCVVGDITRVDALRQLANLYRGTHVDHPKVTLLRGREVTIEGDPAIRVHLDGEPFGGLPLNVRLRPRALRIAWRAGRAGRAVG